MPARTWKVIAAALLIGVAGDTLLRGGTLRLGFALWLALLIVAVLVLGGRGTRERNLLMAGVAAAALGLVVRDADVLFGMDMLSVICTGALLIRHGTGASITGLHAVDVPRVGLLAALNTIAGAPRLAGRAIGDGGSSEERGRTVRALVIGAALALPPLAIVALLLGSSDPVFRDLLERIFAIEGFEHVLLALLLAWMAAGWLAAALGDAIGRQVPEFRTPGLSFTSVSVGLYALLVLLATFVVTQARVLFGGEAFLRAAQGLSIASYARRGFFEMILASGVVLTTLVIADWLLSRDDAGARRRYRPLAIALLVMVVAVLASAGTRIWLYVDRFGLTMDRMLASAVIVWVLAALVLFAWSVLRRRAERFFPALIVVTAAWVALFNVINPEAMVVRVNVARAAAGAPFDVDYHASLSADALPTLVKAAPRLGAARCEQLNHALIVKRWRRDEAGLVQHDWRAMNLAALRARHWYASSTPIVCR